MGRALVGQPESGPQNGQQMSLLSSERSSGAQAGLDSAAVLELGRRWIDGFNERDVDALIACSDRGIEFHPTRLQGNHGPYKGHDGLRRWVADLIGDGAPQCARVTGARCERSGDVLLLGQVVLDETPVSPFALLMSLRDGKILEAHAYLSDEVELKRIGRIDA